MVSTLVVEWIEIAIRCLHLPLSTVSTLVVEWIEMDISMSDYLDYWVSTLVVEWIEMLKTKYPLLKPHCLHPRGGVD